jgi:hypothetical protein
MKSQNRYVVLKQYEELYTLEKKFLQSRPKELLLRSKTKGFADRQSTHGGLFRKCSSYIAYGYEY